MPFVVRTLVGTLITAAVLSLLVRYVAGDVEPRAGVAVWVAAVIVGAVSAASRGRAERMRHKDS